MPRSDSSLSLGFPTAKRDVRRWGRVAQHLSLVEVPSIFAIAVEMERIRNNKRTREEEEENRGREHELRDEIPLRRNGCHCRDHEASPFHLLRRDS